MEKGSLCLLTSASCSWFCFRFLLLRRVEATVVWSVLGATGSCVARTELGLNPEDKTRLQNHGKNDKRLELQFGYKSESSTIMCSTMVIETFLIFYIIPFAYICFTSIQQS